MQKLLIILALSTICLLVHMSSLPERKFTPWDINLLDKDRVCIRMWPSLSVDEIYPPGTLFVSTFSSWENRTTYRPFSTFESSITENDLKRLVDPILKHFTSKDFDPKMMWVRNRIVTESGIDLFAFSHSDESIYIQTRFAGTSLSIDKGYTNKPLLSVSESYYREF